MKRKPVCSTSSAIRCCYLTPTGRQCASPAADKVSGLCQRHATAQPPEDFSVELVDRCGDFQRAQHINYSLRALYRLVAKGRLSPRQGAVLGYIGSLLLRSLTAIDYDNDRFPEEASEEPAVPQPISVAPAPQPAQLPPGKAPLPDTVEGFLDAVKQRDLS